MWQEPGETSYEGTSDANGDDIQKLSVIQSLPNLLAGDAQSCLNKVLPKMQQSLLTASIEFHIAASSAFKTILEQKLVTDTIFTQIFLQSILISLNNSNLIIAHYWLKTLLDVIELLPEDIVKQEILPVSISKGQLSQSVQSKGMCCKLLGKICTRLDAVSIKNEILPTVLSLCQDVSNDVRACICSQLCFVANGLGAEYTKQLLLPSLLDLASDENSFVRKESVPTIVALLPQLQQDTITEIIVPLVKKICDNALKSDDDVICVIAGEIGKLALGTEKYLTEEEKTWFIKYYQQLAKMGIPTINKDDPSKQDVLHAGIHNPSVFVKYVECRKECAVNIPAMLIFASTTKEGANVLLPTFKDLAVDPYFLIRKTIASNIHEVSEIMKSRSGLIKNKLVKLLNDDYQVLQGLVPNLAEALQSLMQNQTSSPDYDSNSMPICMALLKCEDNLSLTNDWRLSAMMWAQLEILPKYFSSDVIYKFFVPVAINRILNARPMPVRLAAGRTLLIFLRYNLKAQQRTEIRNRIYTKLANNKSCYVRILFLRIMEEAMTIFSSNYIKEHFYNSILTMQDDRVANIRLKLVSLFPALKQYLCLPADKRLLTTLDMAVKYLSRSEQDRDVMETLKNVVKELDDIVPPYVLKINSGKVNKLNTEDMRKYEEEVKLAGTSSAKGIGQQSNSTGLPKKHPPAPKLSTISAKTFEDLSASKPTRQGSFQYTSPGPSTPSTSKENQVIGSTFLGKSKSSGIKTPSSLRYDPSKASASSFDLTTNWTRLTSNSMLLSQPWEPLRYPSTETTTNSISATDNITMTNSLYRDDLAKIESTCNCYSLDLVLGTKGFISNDESKPSHSRADNYINQFSNPALAITSSTTPTTTSMTMTTTPTSMSASSSESRRDILHNFLLTRASLPSAQNDYNPYWAFSSVPTMPSTLSDDEFIVDAGISILGLTSSQSASKIPSSTFDYQNHTTNIWSDSTDLAKKNNFDTKDPRNKRYSYDLSALDYEERLKQRTGEKCNTDDKKYADFDDFMMRIVQVTSVPTTTTSTTSLRNKHMNNSEDGWYTDTNLGTQNTIVNDRWKRHSMNFGYKSPSTETESKFKRYSMEVPNFSDKPRLTKRCSTLDVNHNQGISKIPLRSGQFCGSRTAPATRASSPVSLATLLGINRSKLDDIGTGIDDKLSPDQRLNIKFSSSDEEIDKLCHKFMQGQGMTSIRGRESRLPVRTQRKKI